MLQVLCVYGIILKESWLQITNYIPVNVQFDISNFVYCDADNGGIKSMFKIGQVAIKVPIP